jgi:hypothetical protein
MTHLFVGGVADGKWYNVPADRNIFVVPDYDMGLPIRLDAPPVEARLVEYERMRFRGDKREHSVFALNGMSSDGVLARLIHGYRSE